MLEQSSKSLLAAALLQPTSRLLFRSELACVHPLTHANPPSRAPKKLHFVSRQISPICPGQQTFHLPLICERANKRKQCSESWIICQPHLWCQVEKWLRSRPPQCFKWKPPAVNSTQWIYTDRNCYRVFETGKMLLGTDICFNLLSTQLYKLKQKVDLKNIYFCFPIFWKDNL